MNRLIIRAWFVLLLCLAVLLLAGLAGASHAQAATPVRFAVIGDYGGGGQAEQDVADLVKSWNPDFVVTAGDNNYPAGSASTIDDHIGQYYHEFIYPYTGGYGSGAATNRFFPILGNHDWMAMGCDGANCAGPYLDYFTLPGNERYYEFTRGPVSFFMLDSDTHEPDGTSSTSTQASWLLSKLATSTARWNLVFLHHAPYSSANHGSTTRMQWPFAAWGADAIFSGHDHTYERIVVDGIPYFVNGLGGSSRYSFGTPVAGSQVRYRDDYGAMLVEADDTSITFQFISRAGVVIDSYTIGGPPRPPPVNIRVAQSADDAEERVSDGALYLTSSDLELTNDAGYWGQQVVGIRFQNVAVPQGATITRAYIQFVADETQSEPTSLMFYGQAADNAPAFALADHDISGRAKTAASVAWDNVPAWNTVGETHQTPDLSPSVQEVVNRSGWSSGNGVAFIVAGSGHRTAHSYDWGSAAAPLLHVAYLTCSSVDFSGNGQVDVIDVMLAAAQWGTANPTYDFDESGTVGAEDVTSIAGCWSRSVAP
ncbi:MAG: metallophosphoesterase family protein [Anaerolineae bacterium]